MKFAFGSIVAAASLVIGVAAQNNPQSGSSQAVPNQLTSISVTSCGGANVISVTNFQIIYYRYTGAVQFSMIGTASESNLSPIMNVAVSAYGRSLSPQSIDLCQFTSCPLSQGGTNIQGMQNLDVGAQIPSIFWTLPLEATVALQFTDSSSGQLACLTATLSNGVTASSPGVSWATGFATVGLGVAAGIAGVAGSGGSAAGAAQGTQGAPSGASGYPNGASAGTHGNLGGNFGAQAPPQPAGASLGAEAAVVMTIAAGGGGAGTMATAGGAPNHIGLPHIVPSHPTTAAPGTPSGHLGPPVGRMDPITLFLHFQAVSSTGLLSLNYPILYRSFTTNFAWANLIIPLRAFKNDAERFLTCHATSTSNIPPVMSGTATGIAGYSQQLGVDEQDLFMIVFLVFLCACGILLALYFSVGIGIHVTTMTAKDEDKKEIWSKRRHNWQHMSSNNLLRLALAGLGSIATFAFFQWKQQCTSSVLYFLSAGTLTFIVLLLASISFFIIYMSTSKDGTGKLFNKDTTYGRRWGTMYDVLSDQRVPFSVALWVIVLIRSAITGFGQRSGFAQVIAMMTLEIVVCIGLIVYRPYYSRGYNTVNYLIQGNKVFSNVLLLLFVEELHINPIATTVAGFLLLFVNSLIALMLVVLTIIKLGWGRLWYRKKHIAFDRTV